MNMKIRNDQAADLSRHNFHNLAYVLRHWSDQFLIPPAITSQSAETEKEILRSRHHSSCTVTRVSSIGVFKGGPS